MTFVPTSRTPARTNPVQLRFSGRAQGDFDAVRKMGTISTPVCTPMPSFWISFSYDPSSGSFSGPLRIRFEAVVEERMSLE